MHTIEALGLQQWVDFETHCLGNTIDLIFTELASNTEMLRCTPGPFISNHCVVKCEIKYKRDRPIEENITYHKINKIDTNAFVKYFVLTGIIDDLDPTMMIHVFQHELSTVLDEHAPIVTRKLPVRETKPWFNEDIKEQKQKVQRVRYGESTRRIISGWLLKLKSESTEGCLKKQKQVQLAILSWSVIGILESSTRSSIT